MLRKAESVIILEGISRNQPLIMRKCLTNLFHSFNAFFDLSGDNYVDYADDVITKLSLDINISTCTTTFNFLMDP